MPAMSAEAGVSVGQTAASSPERVVKELSSTELAAINEVAPALHFRFLSFLLPVVFLLPCSVFGLLPCHVLLGALLRTFLFLLLTLPLTWRCSQLSPRSLTHRDHEQKRKHFERTPSEERRSSLEQEWGRLGLKFSRAHTPDIDMIDGSPPDPPAPSRDEVGAPGRFRPRAFAIGARACVLSLLRVVDVCGCCRVCPPGRRLARALCRLCTACRRA
eukprot:684511-Rhodomonas_salina.5